MPPKAKRPAAKKAYKKKAPARKPKGGKKKAPAAQLVTVRQQNLGQQTENKVVLYHGKPDTRAKIMKAVSPLCHYVDTGSGAITTEGFNGRQCWGYIELAASQDLTNIGTFLAAQNTKAAQGFSPSTPATVPLNPPASYLLTRLEHNLKFSNLGQANVRLSLIHCRAKRDVYNQMEYVSPLGTTYSWGTIVDAIQQGVSAAANGTTSGSVQYFIPGVDETESPIFNKYFSKLKTTQIFLSVGGTHTLHTNCLYDRVLDASVYGNDLMNNIMGVTDIILFKAEGQTGITNGDPPAVSIAQCQLGWTANYDYSFVQVANSRVFMAITDPIESNANTVSVISGSTGSGVTATGLIT